jgi:hypothetical protein
MIVKQLSRRSRARWWRRLCCIMFNLKVLWFPVAYYSRSLKPAEVNYMNYEREGLALVASIKHFRQYLLGRDFIVYTDNSAVAAIYKEKDPVGWVHTLNEYSCEIRHRNGKLLIPNQDLVSILQ